MERLTTTVVALVGAGERATASLKGRANVTFYQAESSLPPIERATATWGEARRSHTPYFVHEADPLSWVATAWAARFEGSGQPGDLEVAVAETLSRWRARSLELPDYYVVFSPEALTPTLRHWYLGVLAGARQHRVAVASQADDLGTVLSALPAGPWWPGIDSLLKGIENTVPEQAGLHQVHASPAQEQGAPGAGSSSGAG